MKMEGINKTENIAKTDDMAKNMVNLENSSFSGLGEKFKKYGRILSIATMISIAIAAGSEQANAQSPTMPNPTEKSMEHTSKIKWADESMNRMKTDINELKTNEDVVVFERIVIKPFIYNIGMLSEGKEVQSNYSLEEYKKILLDVQEMKKTFGSIEKKLNVEGFASAHDNIEYLIKILNMRTSYSGFHEYKKLYNLE
jgi:hypothetical protein